MASETEKPHSGQLQVSGVLSHAVSLGGNWVIIGTGMRVVDCGHRCVGASTMVALWAVRMKGVDTAGLPLKEAEGQADRTRG